MIKQEHVQYEVLHTFGSGKCFSGLNALGYSITFQTTPSSTVVQLRKASWTMRLMVEVLYCADQPTPARNRKKRTFSALCTMTCSKSQKTFVKSAWKQSQM